MSLHFLQKNEQCSTAVSTTTGGFYARAKSISLYHNSL